MKLEPVAREPHVLVAPSSTRAPDGGALGGGARILADPADEAVAERAVQQRFRLGRRVDRRLICGAPAVDVEVTPTGEGRSEYGHCRAGSSMPRGAVRSMPDI